MMHINLLHLFLINLKQTFYMTGQLIPGPLITNNGILVTTKFIIFKIRKCDPLKETAQANSLY